MSTLSAIMNPLILGRMQDKPGPFDPAQVSRILVVRNDNIGDVICTTPALDALRTAFPRAFIAALVCTLAEEAISGHPALDALYVYPKAKHRRYGWYESHRRLTATLAEVRKQKFDLAICFRASFSSSQAWLAYASRARWRLGPEARGKKARLSFYYNLPAPWPPEGIHEVERCFHLLRQIQVDREDKRLYLEVPAKAQEAAAGFLARNGLEGGSGPMVLNITRWAYRLDRLWPEQNYLELARELSNRAEGLVITHAPADKEWVAGIMGELNPRPAVFFSPSLKEFCALAAHARVFITAEGGPMHLAAAVGAPLAVLWGNTPLEVWRPWGVPHRILGGKGPVADITVPQVLAAVEELSAQAPRQRNGES